MIKTTCLFDKTIQYDLQRKKVKNINLRIKPDGTVHVSANKRIPQKVIEDFVLSTAEFIRMALEKCENTRTKPQKQYFAENKICDVIIRLCEKVYPYFEKRGIQYPQIKFRRMISRWGSCHPTKGILTFNINLMYASSMLWRMNLRTFCRRIIQAGFMKSWLWFVLVGRRTEKD